MTSESKRVLIVDADPGCRSMIAQVLEDLGYQPLAVTAITDALSTARFAVPAAIILDLHWDAVLHGSDLPDIPDTLDLLKSDEPTSALPVIACSTSTVFLGQQAARLRRYGCRTLLKPFDISDLMASVESAIHSSSSALTSAAAAAD